MIVVEARCLHVHFLCNFVEYFCYNFFSTQLMISTSSHQTVNNLQNIFQETQNNLRKTICIYYDFFNELLFNCYY